MKVLKVTQKLKETIISCISQKMHDMFNPYLSAVRRVESHAAVKEAPFHVLVITRRYI